MPIALTDDHIELQKTAADFLARRQARAASRALLEAPTESLPTWWSELAGLGWLGLHIPEAHGGSGYGLEELVVVVEQMGRAVAPGPFPDLRLPPTPAALAARPLWWFHPFGIEQARARTLRVIAAHADHLATWSETGSAVAAPLLARLPGVGPWTTGHVLASAWGDPDAVPTGDFHLPNTVVHALTGRSRGTDAEMLELLEPYRGQRGRVVRLLQLDGHRAPAFGARRRIEPHHRR